MRCERGFNQCIVINILIPVITQPLFPSLLAIQHSLSNFFISCIIHGLWLLHWIQKVLNIHPIASLEHSCWFQLIKSLFNLLAVTIGSSGVLALFTLRSDEIRMVGFAGMGSLTGRHQQCIIVVASTTFQAASASSVSMVQLKTGLKPDLTKN